MSFFDGNPRVATKEHCNAPWSGDKKNFRCGFCGHRFKEGDTWRAIFTNHIPEATGNPLICADCYTTAEEAQQKWAEKWKEYMNDKWWWFRRLSVR